METQVLNIEQMKLLKRSGISTDQTLLYWHIRLSGPKLVKKPSSAAILEDYKSHEAAGFGIGAFTLQDVLDIIPGRLNERYLFRLFKLDEDYICEYSCEGEECTLHTAPMGTALETVFHMLLWLIDNKHI